MLEIPYLCSMEMLVILQVETAVGWFERALSQPAGSFAFVLAVFIGVFFLGVWITRFITSNKVHRERNREDVNSLKGKLDGFTTDVAVIKGQLINISDRLDKMGQMSQGLTQAHSPVSLTELGKETAAKIGVDKMVQRNFSGIISFLDEQIKDKNAYDIQQFCIETAGVSPERFFLPEDVARLKDFAFNEGKNLYYYGSMIGVIIRDAYFKERGINTKEVDEHDPKKKVNQG
ncbi:MAG: hypothetical protein NC048_10005 [Bacteroides sp.]|nr:hypothetical protein [Bacteroides sp.]